jgi:hypothetical protein
MMMMSKYCENSRLICTTVFSGGPLSGRLYRRDYKGLHTITDWMMILTIRRYALITKEPICCGGLLPKRGDHVLCANPPPLLNHDVVTLRLVQTS